MSTVEKTKTDRPNGHNSGEAGPVRHSFSDGGFDPAGLFAQLSRLLELYLARAEDPDALANMAPKDALACAKTVMALMADLQGGKPAAVGEHTEWPMLSSPRWVQPPIQAADHRSRRPDSRRHPFESPIFSLEDAVSAVCNYDEETQALEPWARLIARIDEMCIHIQKQLDEAPQRAGGAHQRRSENGDCEKGTNSRAGESPTRHSRCGDGAPGLPCVSADGADAQQGLENPDFSFGDSSRPPLPAARYCESEAGGWDPGDNGEPPEEPVLGPPVGDDPGAPALFQLIESASADEVSENDNGNNTDFPARRNPRGP
ncbi:hypothetical protein J7J84_06800 [bacterium]|nr:hypothetical protein [bacterium]